MRLLCLRDCAEAYIQFYQRQDVLPDGSLDEAMREKCLKELHEAKAEPAPAVDEDIEDIFAS